MFIGDFIKFCSKFMNEVAESKASAELISQIGKRFEKEHQSCQYGSRSPYLKNQLQTLFDGMQSKKGKAQLTLAQVKNRLEVLNTLHLMLDDQMKMYEPKFLGKIISHARKEEIPGVIYFLNEINPEHRFNLINEMGVINLFNTIKTLAEFELFKGFIKDYLHQNFLIYLAKRLPDIISKNTAGEAVTQVHRSVPPVLWKSC